tara:strand:+ start:1057 stop:4335 length:3279 start_codon:yes stop_codon:yes gene_type:complete
MTAQAPTNFVLKAYPTEALARAGGHSNALRINDPDDEEGSIVNNASQAANYGYWTFQRYWYRIESNEPVSEFYIDWDDGENNSPEKANVSIIKTDKPSFFGVTSHIYTQAKKHFPLIRVKSVDGFLSKWYTPHASNGASAALNTFAGLDDNIKTTASSGIIYDQGQNSFSVVSVERNDDGTDFARIPVLEPANVPSIGVLKTDRKRVFSGIDNTWIGNNGRVLDETSAEYPDTSTLHAICSNQNRAAVNVKVTYQEGVLGGVSAVSQISTTEGVSNAGGSGERGFTTTELEGKSLIYRAMDETYGVYITWTPHGAGSGCNSSPPAEAGATGVTPLAANIATESSGDASAYVSPEKVAVAIATALDGVTYHGRSQFTSARAAGFSGRSLINTTHTDAGVVALPTIEGSGVAVFEETGSGSDYYAPRFTTAGVDASDGTIKQRTVVTNAFDTTGRIENVARVLRMELVNNLENSDTAHTGSTGTSTLAPGERVYLQANIQDAEADGLPDSGDRMNNVNVHSTICSVSLGNPIVELDSLGSSLTVDATESKIRCSNKSVSAYYIDDNKLISGDTTGNRQDHQAADTTYNITDKIVDGQDFKDTVGVKDLRYSFEWFRDFQDSNYRFYPQKRLLRCQVADDHTQAADDGYNRSPIVSFDASSYLTVGAAQADADGLPSEVAKHNYGAFLFTNRAKIRTPEWFDLNVTNRGDRTQIFGCDTNTTHTLLSSTAYDTLTTTAHYAPDNVSNADGDGGLTDADTVGPRNALFMARKEKFDRIFVRVSHDRLTAAGLDMSVMATRVDNTIGANGEGLPEVRIQALYPAKKTRNSSTIVWKPLKVIDRTRLKNKDNSSFYTSGDITFIPPSDWEKTQHSTNVVYPYESSFMDEKGSGTDGIDDKWNQDSYALLFLITMIASDGDGSGLETLKPCFNVMHMYPFNNSHSQMIEIVDPMHVSLNKHGIAQSISFVRKGRYQEIKDRSGISMLRRVGAEGGSIKLGSIDLAGDPHTTRAKFDEYVKDAVPVYYDVTHEDSSITRLFGTMVDMSEDHPTAKVKPKFACTMKVTHMLEIDSSGNIIGDGYKPLGGDVIDVGQYLSAA